MDEISLVKEQLIELTKIEEIEVRILISKPAVFLKAKPPKLLHAPRKNNLIDLGKILIYRKIKLPTHQSASHKNGEAETAPARD